MSNVSKLRDEEHQDHVSSDRTRAAEDGKTCVRALPVNIQNADESVLLSRDL